MKDEKKYETPIITIVTFASDDIIRTSGQFGEGYDANHDYWDVGL